MGSVFMFVFLVLGLAGCQSTGSIYEREDLVTVAHNNASDYTLLVYRDTKGRTRKVIRRKGVCEMMLVEKASGEYLFKERGRDARMVMPASVADIEAYIENMVYNPGRMADQAPKEGGVF